MDEFGHILREARETKGLSVKDVQEEIRINARYLEALEMGEYDSLPSPIHVRGFLKNYARFLGLDPDPLLNRYEQRLDYKAPQPAVLNNSDQTKPQTLIPARQDQPFFDPVNYQVADNNQQRDTESILRLVVIVALIIAIGLVANRFIPFFSSGQDGSEAITESITNALEDLQNPDASATPESESTPDGTAVFGDLIVSTERNNVDNALPTVSPTRPPLPATMETIQLKLEILERAWMEVTIDGNVVFTGIAKKGDPPYEWEAQDEAKVVTGNAIGVYATVNDVPLGRLGARGENKEEVWRTTN